MKTIAMMMLLLATGCAASRPAPTPPPQTRLDTNAFEKAAARWRYPVGKLQGHHWANAHQEGGIIFWAAETNDSIEKVLQFYVDLTGMPELADLSSGGLIKVNSIRGEEQVTYGGGDFFGHRPGDPFRRERVLVVRWRDVRQTILINQEPSQGPTRIIVISDDANFNRVAQERSLAAKSPSGSVGGF